MKTRNNQQTRKDYKKIGTRTYDIKALAKAEFIKKHPVLYDSWVKEGREKGQAMERERIGKLIAMKKQPEFYDIPQVVAVIDKGIEDGTTPKEIQPLIMKALLKVRNDPARAKAAADESPPDIGGFGIGRPEMDIPGRPRKNRKGVITEV